jgi:hypothetical protein
MNIPKQQNLLELLYSINDPRRAQGRMHPLPFILLTSIMAIMNGATSIYAIADFAKSNKKDLFKLFKMKKKQKRIPSKETIARVFRLISFENLSSIFYNWAKSKISIKKGDCLSLDGKSIRGTLTNANDSFQNFTSLVSVYSQKMKQILCLGKIETKKESEIPEVRKLIKMLDLEGVTFTMDALHCQKQTVKEIIESKNNYIVQVKGNQPTLQEDLKKTSKISYLEIK